MHTDMLEPDTGVTCDLVMHVQHCVSQGHSDTNLYSHYVPASSNDVMKQRHNSCMLVDAAYKAMRQSLV